MSVRMDLAPLMKLGAVIDEWVLKQWGARYRRYARREYVENSRGGGRWPRLHPSTIRRRRKGQGSGPAAEILWDTGTIIGALDFKFQRKAGQLQDYLRARGVGGRAKFEGVRVGFGGPGRHPVAKRPVAMLAEAHHSGLGHLPERPIITEPDTRTLDGMGNDVERRWRTITRRTR